MFAEHVQEDLNRKVCLECNRQFTGLVYTCPHDGSVLVDFASDPLIGTVLADNYEILSVIGHGGMGVVYKAHHTLMDRMVAIKMLKAQLISDSVSVRRFQQEGKATSRISHPHVITVYHFGISPSAQPFIVMDYLQGVSLAEVIKKEGHIGVERTIRIMSQACDALSHAHRQGVVHRDLKPSNIVLINYEDNKDYVKVVDFGVAMLLQGGSESQRLTQAGEVCGSPVYMSPEQCQGLELDRRSDIYSMGVVLYETLTGKLPFLGKTMVETMSKHIGENPPGFAQIRPDLYIPERLESVVLKCLQKDRNDRHQTMEELRKDLELSIPRPAKSLVLRSTVEIPKAVDQFSLAVRKLSLKHWIVIAIVLVAGLAFSLVLFRQLTHPQITSSEKQTRTSPPAVKPLQVDSTAVPTPGDRAGSVLEPKLNSSLKTAPKVVSVQKPTTVQVPPSAHQVRMTNPFPRTTIKQTLDSATTVPVKKHAYSTFSRQDVFESGQGKASPTERKRQKKHRFARISRSGKQMIENSDLSVSVKKTKRDPWDALWELKRKSGH